MSEKKKIIAYINAENEVPENVVRLADRYSCNGADELFIYNYTGDEERREKFLHIVRKIDKIIDIPFSIGLYVNRFEDAKKALYTGATYVVLRKVMLPVEEELNEIISRFDSDKLAIEVDMLHDFHDSEKINKYFEMGFGNVILKHVELGVKLNQTLAEVKKPVIIRDSLVRNNIVDILSLDNVDKLATNYYEEKNIYKAKNVLIENNISVDIFKSSVEFSELKKDQAGLVPVIVQDYRTNEVLMLAYMNEEAFYKTFDTGMMTYYSRSRKSLWVKGETSGHFQYVKSVEVDCDSDTLLAKVRQVGAACHTGNRTCFFTNLARKKYVDTNPMTVLKDDYDTIYDRKVNPKEGSYTNYLFDKGLDKILKKVGEESSEILIASKNEDKEELKYEIADFMYHLMVLMIEKGLDWEDVMKELVNRR
ncbi:MAG: bifunctional phosphoribosyl-AMP cyclohydrolase/phosphoribosyl-ATP diphosphatase HisIE [Lachnospiraceae bacterium]|nr:bifunctional phosphoribosyl-AMP cyclohydrolase/phosphoribosyl-ATP diphosphatase HisIE [Lachnospiraceae bacterium]